jgi:uncharacterized protein YbaP (TraB family)
MSPPGRPKGEDRSAQHEGIPVIARCLLALLLCLCCAAAVAQPAAPGACPPQPQPQPITAEQAQAGLRGAQDHGFLWRIARDSHVSYLYGTVHVAQRQWLFPGPELVRAVKASDTIALELDMLDPDIQRRLAAGMQADPAEHLPDALAERLRAQVRAACLPAEEMAALAPAMQLAALTTLVARWDGLDPSYAIDSFLAGFGRGLGKTVVSLESPEMQIALLKGDPKTAEQELDHGLQQIEQGQMRPMLVHIAQVWADGKEDELERYEKWCGCADTDAERAELKRMLDDRNGPLAERIDALHRSGQRVFAAVGALHMVGPHGLPRLMAARGYSVQRVELPR